MPESTLRIFIAIELPERERRRLASVIARLETGPSLLKLVSPQSLHITLRFLGATPTSRLGAVDEAASAAASRGAPFELGLAGIGAFPNERSPRVIWAGLADNRGLASLRALAQYLDEALQAHGFPREQRAFSPHITLARARDGLLSEQRRQIGARLVRTRADVVSGGGFTVRSITVMRSDLRPTGPVYTPLYVATLGERRMYDEAVMDVPDGGKP